MEKIILPQVRDLGQTIGDSFLFVRVNFKFLIRFFLFYIIPPLLVAVALFAFGYKKNNLYSGQSLTRYSALSHLDGLGLLGYLLYILTMLFQHLYITELMILKEHNEEVTLGQALIQLKADAGKIVATFFLFMVLMVPVLIVAGILVALASMLGGSASGFSVFILILAGGYAVFPLGNLFFVRLREKLDMVEAIKKCFQISRGYWWKTFIGWLVIAITFYAFIVSLMAPFGMVIYLMQLHAIEPGQTNFLGYALLGIAGSVAVLMYFFILNVFQIFFGVNYFSLSEQYDSFHLKAQIEEIGIRAEQNIHRQEGEY